MLNIAVVEDDDITQQNMREFLDRYAAENEIEIKKSFFSDGSEILENYKADNDIIFLDIEMKSINGIETAEKIREKDKTVVLIFVTNVGQYAIDGYSVGALDYVLKPMTYPVFVIKMDRARSMVTRNSSETLLLNHSQGMVKLETRQIYYVEIQNRILHYHTELGEFTMRGTLQSAEKQLSDHYFVRCNYWYLVNLYHVQQVKGDVVEIAGNKLDISRRNRAAFLAALADYVGGGM